MTVYMHVVPNGKRYIGITAAFYPHELFKDGSGYIENKVFYSDIQKFGWNNIEHITVMSGLSIPEACNLEMQLIREFDTTNPDLGYNTSPGGDYYRHCKDIAPEQEEMNEILRQTAKTILDLIK